MIKTPNSPKPRKITLTKQNRPRIPNFSRILSCTNPKHHDLNAKLQNHQITKPKAQNYQNSSTEQAENKIKTANSAKFEKAQL